jgi:hypothetical protein
MGAIRRRPSRQQERGRLPAGRRSGMRRQAHSRDHISEVTVGVGVGLLHAAAQLIPSFRHALSVLSSVWLQDCTHACAAWIAVEHALAVGSGAHADAAAAVSELQFAVQHGDAVTAVNRQISSVVPQAATHCALGSLGIVPQAATHACLVVSHV